MLSRAEQDYLKAIYEMQHEQGEEWITTTRLAQALGVSPASVTEMLKRLAASDPELVLYERYHGVRLSEAGEPAALEVIRHHRLLERFLSEVLGYGWDEVHDEADRLEHAISEEMEERIADLLGQPQVDPHGSPIPNRDGTVAHLDDLRLSELGTRQIARICRVSDHNSQLLRYLAELELTLGTVVEVTTKAPFDGPQFVHLVETDVTHPLGHEVTDHVFVVRGQDR